jgi:tetratricopeptide (TPR) repeat protein
LGKVLNLERAGDVDGAIKMLEWAIARGKKPGPLYNKLAVILLNQRKDYPRAEKLLRLALELEPDNPIFRQNLVKLLGLAATTHEKKKGGLLSRLLSRK